MHKSVTTLLKWPICKSRPKTTIDKYNRSLQSPGAAIMENIFVHVMALYKTVASYIKSRGTTFVHLERYCFSNQAFSFLFDSRHFSQFTAKPERQQRKMAHTHEHIKTWMRHWRFLIKETRLNLWNLSLRLRKSVTLDENQRPKTNLIIQNVLGSKTLCHFSALETFLLLLDCVIGRHVNNTFVPRSPLLPTFVLKWCISMIENSGLVKSVFSFVLGWVRLRTVALMRCCYKTR